MKSRLIIAMLLLFATAKVKAFDLGEHFKEAQSWEESAELFAVDHRCEGFVFASDERDIVNSLDHDSCTWNGLKVWETKIYFERGEEASKVKRVEISLYNRGDAKDETIDHEELDEKIAQVARVFNEDKKGKAKLLKLPTGGIRMSRTFDRGEFSAELVWGLSEQCENNLRRVEYLRLTLTRKDNTKKVVRYKRLEKAGGDIKKNVTKSPNGDVYIDGVPMVNQGQKGYCAAAVSERVLRYFGFDVDEHEIAQQAGTTAEGGTSLEAMKETIKEIGNKRTLAYKELISFPLSMKQMQEDIDAYNKAAKLEKRQTLKLEDFCRDNCLYFDELSDAMEPRVILKMKATGSKYRTFLSEVRKYVNSGIPIFWSVRLGIYPEAGVNPQTSGGHMRLIIGYNDKKKEVLFTDTWGQGHELKRMPENWAFAITKGFFILKPR